MHCNSITKRYHVILCNCETHEHCKCYLIRVVFFLIGVLEHVEVGTVEAFLVVVQVNVASSLSACGIGQGPAALDYTTTATSP